MHERRSYFALLETKAKIRILAADYEKRTKKTNENLRETIDEVRIEAETKGFI